MSALSQIHYNHRVQGEASKLKAPESRKNLQKSALNRSRIMEQKASVAEKKVVGTCIRRTLDYAAQHGFETDRTAQQFLELTRALTNPDGTPYNAANSTIQKAMETRYQAISSVRKDYVQCRDSDKVRTAGEAVEDSSRN